MPLNRRQLKTTLAQFYDHPVARVSLELFLSVGAVIFFAVFAIRPTLLTISDLLREIDQKTEIDSQLSQKVASLSSIQSAFLDLQGRLFVLEQAIPSQPDFITTAKIIEKIASDRQLAISNLQVTELPSGFGPGLGPRPEQDQAAGLSGQSLADETTAAQDRAAAAPSPDQLDQLDQLDQPQRASYNLSFTISGDYLTIREFVQDIINNRRMLVVDTVQFTSNVSQGDRSLNAIVTLSAPYFSNHPN
ncbi:MAG: hypothetical protein COU69_03380 [Candidatus Pacebacteria bacterium CG10_big_fil_rev_8_21_14_0_10_56_10]|nr:MAG: hypothetical protein COU69_03380 [Candidatus Pacebacteria bacterium CG10_big_fil_rev_8_21_14_0_10_56_10]